MKETLQKNRRAKANVEGSLTIWNSPRVLKDAEMFEEF